jgi:hypothetical protein
MHENFNAIMKNLNYIIVNYIMFYSIVRGINTCNKI